MRIFKEKNINPIPGMALQLDNYLVKILSVSGGRVIVDFNNPLAGKEIDYDFEILRKVEDNKEKINALQDFFFRMRFDFEIKEDEKTKTKKVIFNKQEIKPFIEIFKKKFKDMTGLEFEVQAEEKKQEGTKEDKNKEKTD